MPERRNGGTLAALFERLHKAVGRFYADGEVIGEVNAKSN